MKCHLVSRFLTQPWEVEHRKLVYVDLDQGRVLRRSSKSLFARPDAFSPRAERMFGEAFETALGRWRSRWDGTEDVPAIDGQTAVAMYLAMLLAVPRVTALSDLPSTKWLNDLAEKPTEDRTRALDVLASAFWEHRSLAVCRQDLPVFFPETAVFAVAVPDPACLTGWGHLMMMAVAPKLVIVLSPPGMDVEKVMTSRVRPGHLHNASKGVAAHCRKVVVPPDLVDTSADALVAAVGDAQRQAQEIFDRVGELRSLVVRAHETFGLTVVEDRAGRFAVR